MTAPHFDSEHATIWHGDCIDVMRELPDNSVDAVVTDPPYGLEFMGKEWDAPWQSGTGIGGHNAGFGEFTLADGRTRMARPNYTGSTNPGCLNCGGKKHGTDPTQRKVCACAEPRFQNITLPRMRAFQSWCEDWATEALRVLKPGGHLLAFGGTRTFHRLAAGIEDAGFEIRDSIAWLYGSGFPKSLDVSKAIDKAAGAEREVLRMGDSDGYVRKPHALAPGGGERDAISAVTAPATDDAARWQGWGTALKPAFEPIVVARKPLVGTVAANVLTYGTGALNIDASRIGTPEDKKHPGTKTYTRFDTGSPSKGTQVVPPHTVGRWPANVILDASQAAALDAQSGITRDGVAVTRNIAGKPFPGEVYGLAGSMKYSGEDVGYGGQGGASRFFYTAKASTDERPSVDGIVHPTVKPVDLMRWLVRLVTPKGGTVLEPFAGSGTTVEAAVLEGFRCIAIEREADYLPLIMQRISKPHAVGLDFGDWEDAS